VLEAVDGSLLREAGGALGVGTANVAEYRGLIAGLEAAAEFGLRQLEVRIDSQLVVAQMTGERQIKNPTLAAFAERARELGNKVGPFAGAGSAATTTDVQTRSSLASSVYIDRS
jgi:ribonuclease HI